MNGSPTRLEADRPQQAQPQGLDDEGHPATQDAAEGLGGDAEVREVGGVMECKACGSALVVPLGPCERCLIHGEPGAPEPRGIMRTFRFSARTEPRWRRRR